MGTSLRWHPFPISATDIILGNTSATESHHLVAHCFAWHSSSSEELIAGEDVEELTWCSIGEVAKLGSAEGVSFSKLVLSPVRIADEMIRSSVMLPDRELF